MSSAVEFLRYKKGFIYFRQNEKITKIKLFDENITKKIFLLENRVVYSENEELGFEIIDSKGKLSTKKIKDLNISFDKKNKTLKIKRMNSIEPTEKQYEIEKNDYKIVTITIIERPEWDYHFTVTKEKISFFTWSFKKLMFIDEKNNSVVLKATDFYNSFDATRNFYHLNNFKRKLAIREVLINCNCNINLIKLKMKLMPTKGDLK